MYNKTLQYNIPLSELRIHTFYVVYMHAYSYCIYMRAIHILNSGIWQRKNRMNRKKEKALKVVYICVYVCICKRKIRIIYKYCTYYRCEYKAVSFNGILLTQFIERKGFFASFLPCLYIHIHTVI